MTNEEFIYFKSMIDSVIEEYLQNDASLNYEELIGYAYEGLNLALMSITDSFSFEKVRESINTSIKNGIKYERDIFTLNESIRLADSISECINTDLEEEEDSELLSLLNFAFRDLSKREKMALTMLYYQDMPSEIVAQELHVSDPEVKDIETSALERLNSPYVRRLLQNYIQ